MASMNLLQIVQILQDELGLNRTAVVVNSTDTQTRQIYSLINRALRELQQNYDWTFLQTEYDLHVSQPYGTTGNTVQGSYTITEIPASSVSGAFSDAFGSAFSQDTSIPIPDLLISNPNLWVVSGPFVVVNTRITNFLLQLDGTYTAVLDQPTTGSETDAQIVFSQDTYPEPVDFSRFINQTWWDRTNRWALMGPDSPQVDQWHRSGIVTIGPRRHFRQIGYNGLSNMGGDFNQDYNNDFNNQAGITNNYRIWPAPGATDTPIDLVYEYISENIVLSSRGVAQPNFQADTDYPIVDYNMLILEAKWRFWQIKGFDYLPMQQESIDYIDRRYAQDGGSKTLSLPSTRGNFVMTTGIVQDGSWPGSSGSM